jgi:RsiW-degrading membrane proteinase PrsW (M82 family)
MEPMILKALIALTPVVACLIVFERLDAFKLVSLSDVLMLLGAGGALTAISYFANGGVLDEFPVGFDNYARYVAPAVEESMKAALIVVLFGFNRIGYLIDAAIAGFAIGAGFALAENAFYLHEFANADLGVWIVRGFGTALMHGGASALMSVLSLVLYAPRLRADASSFRFNVLLFMPGLGGAILLHMAFNHFPEYPLLAMMVALLATPLGLFGLFALGESYAHRWLAEDSRSHAALLEAMRDGTFAATDAGRALAGLSGRLDRAVAADLWSYVELNVELVVSAEATLLAIEENRAAPDKSAILESYHRLHDLERSLGRSLAMAVRQHLRFSRDDLWKMHELEIFNTRHALKARSTI